MAKKYKTAVKLLEGAKNAWLNKLGTIQECITKLSEAINIMEGIFPHFGDKVLLNQHLFEAYSMRALFVQTATPKSERIVEDLKVAISLWPNDKTLPTCMFYHITDLLQMKGSMKLQNDLYLLLIKIFEQQISMSSTMHWFSTLWTTRRLNHPLCHSPISESFIHNYVKLHHRSKLLEEKLSSHFKDADDNERCFVDEISDNEDPSNTFALAYALLENSKQQASTGDVDKAFKHAQKSHQYFAKIALEAQEVISKGMEFCLLDDRLVQAQEVISKGVEFCLLDDRVVQLQETYITPWKAIQGYLESLLQLGMIYEQMGKGHEARCVFLEGSKICDTFDFPLLFLLFSTYIEKLYTRGLEQLDNVNLPGALKYFEKSKELWGCLKCNSLIRSILYGNHKSKYIAAAKENHNIAVKEINSSIWKNNVSSSKVDGNEVFRADGWKSLSSHFSKSKSLDDLVNLKWECVRRKLAMELYIELGECYSDADKVGEILLQSLSLLVGGNSFDYAPKSFHQDFFANFVAIENPEDIFAIQRAEVIHSVCWYSLKHYRSEFVRNYFGCLLSFGKIASCLKVAFVLSRGVPHILQKVSTLLSVMYVISCSSKKLCLSSISDGLSESIWSAYFHQISIGTNLTNKFHWQLSGIFEDPHVASSCIFGYTPKNTKELLEHVKNFMVGLSSATIACMSVLEVKYVTLLQALPLSHFLPKDTNSMLLISRLDFERNTFTIITPTPKGFAVDVLLKQLTNTVRHVPIPTAEEGEEGVESFHQKELSRNGSLKAWLRVLEETWFGPCKCLFQGEGMNSEHMDSVLKKLENDLRPICASVDVIKNLLKMILGGYQSFEVEKLKTDLRTKNSCSFIAKKGHYEALCNMLPLKGREVNIFEQAFEQAFKSMEVSGFVRKPIIFVFDSHLQMIPWENIPVGMDQEIYRMPSVSSIFTLLEYHKKLSAKEELRRNLEIFPSMDPKNAFYIINAVKDLVSKFTDVESLTKLLKGFKDCKPTNEEMAGNIKMHDLFMCFGHKWVWPAWEHMNSTYIEKESRAVVMLMGCETVDIELQGRYAPKCDPYSYLLVGCPAVFANLWKVTDLEMDLLGSGLYREWSAQRLNDPGKHGIAAFMPQARKACQYPFLTGASTICYGIPTKICQKDNTMSCHLPSKRKHSEFNS